MAATEIDPELIARINYEFETFGHMLPETLEKYKAAAAGVREFEMKMNLATKATGALYQSFTTYNRAVYDGIKGYKDLAATTDSLATSIEAVTAALAFILPIGRAAKIAVAGLGLLAGEATRFSKVIGEQADNVRKGFDGLAEIGATAGDGMQGVFEGIQRLGLGVQDAEHMIRLLADNAETVSLFGGTMKQGSRVFEDTVDSMKPMANDFLSLGIQFKDFSTVGMNYLRVQKQMTMGTKEQMDTSGAAVKRYVEEMDNMTRLTGLSRKKQEEILEDAYREEAFAAKMDDLRAQAAEAKRNGNKAEEDRINNAVDMYEKGLRHAAGTSKEMAEAYMTGVSGFVGNSEKSIALFQASNGKIQELNNNIEKGAIKTDEELAQSFRGVNKAVGEFGQTFRQNYMAKAMGGFGVSYETTRRAAQRANMSVEEYAKTLKEAEAEQAEQMGKNGKQEELLAKMNEMLMKANKEMLKSQQAVQGMMGGYMTAVGGTTSAMDALRNAAIAAAEALGLIGGKKKPPEPQAPVVIAGGTGSVESRRTQEAVEVRKQAEDAQAAATAERKRLEAEKGRGAEETKAARIAEMKARDAAAKARAEEEHKRRQQSQAAGMGGNRVVTPATVETDLAIAERKVVEAEKNLAARKAKQTEEVAAREAALKKLQQQEAALKGKANAQLTSEIKAAQDELKKSKANDSAISDAEQKLAEATKEAAELRKKLNETVPGANAGPAPEAAAGNKQTPATPTTPNTASGAALKTEIQKPDGSKEVRTGGTISWRNNNPGNLRDGSYSREYGSIGTAGGFAVFPDKATGEKAREKLIFESKLYKDKTLRDMIHTYAPAADNNNTEAYLSAIVKATGAKPETKTSDLTPQQRTSMLAIMQKHEGWKEGKVDVVKADDKNKPKLADGGIVKARPGGTEVIVGEANQAEAVIPLRGGAVPVHLDSTPTFAGMNEYKGYNQGPMTTDLSMLEQIAGKLGAYDKSTKMITDPKLWKELLQSNMMTNYDFGEVAVGTKDLSSRVGSETVADAIAGRIKELIDNKKGSSEAIDQTKTEVADMMKTFYEDFFAKMNAQMTKENPVDLEMLAVLKDISKTNAAAAGSSEKMLQVAQN